MSIHPGYQGASSTSNTGMVQKRCETGIGNNPKEDKRLYEKYGKPLEAEHKEDYAAIASNSQVILGKSTIEVFSEAVKKFGSGEFALVRIGYPAVWKWLGPTE